MKDKKIRPYMLKWWLSVQFKGVVGFTTIFLLMSGLYMYIIGYFAAENTTSRKIIIETIAWMQNMTVIASIIFVVFGSIMYKGWMATPLKHGSTRREAQVGYEIFTVLCFGWYTLVYFGISLVNSLYAGSDSYFTHIFDILMIYVLFEGIIKFLYANYVGKEGSSKYILMAGNIFFLCAMSVVVALYMIFMYDKDIIFNKFLWLYPIIYIIGIVLWIISAKILERNREMIALSDLEVQY